MKLITILLACNVLLTTAQSGCNSGIQAALAPLADYPPAQSYCSAKYPRTVTVKAVGKRAVPSTTNTAKSATTTTNKPTTTTTPKAIASTTKSTTSTTKAASTTTKDAKAALYSSLIAQASAVVSTFCNCRFPPVTVTSSTTTTSKTTTSTTTSTTTTSTTTPPTTTEPTTTTVPSTTSSPVCSPTPVSDPRCQDQSGLCCPQVQDSCTPCTNQAVVCVKACNTDNDCIYGGLANQYDTVVAYNDGVCAAYSGCSGCPAAKLFKKDSLGISDVGRRRVEIKKSADMIMRRVI